MYAIRPPTRPRRCALKILHGMKYHIRTALGITEDHFSNMVDWILGTLQGSGASACIWLAISAVLIAALEQQSQVSPSAPSMAQYRMSVLRTPLLTTLTCMCVSVDTSFPQLAQQAQVVA